MNHTATESGSERTAGGTARQATLDLARLAAAWGVVAVHCSPHTRAAGVVVGMALNVCVPFFLLTSLSFFWHEVRISGDAGHACRRRWARLLGPYVAWTVIYFAARCLKLGLQGRSLRGEFMPAHLVTMLGEGGAAVQLYFLPLLALALGLGWALAPWLQRLSGRALAVAAVVSLGVWLGPSWSGGAGSGPLAHLAARYAGWLVWLLPVVLAAAALTHGLAGARPRRALGWTLLAVAAGLEVAIAAGWFYAWRLHSLVLAALVLAACHHLPMPAATARARWLAPLLRCSLGIFLVHDLVIEAIEFVDARAGGWLTQPYSLGSLLPVSVVVVAVSAAFTLTVARAPAASRVLFGR
jgi:surface polysaccharide O-acyltransferase-like enzyme